MRLNRFHYTVKRVIGSSRTSLVTLVQSLLTIVDARTVEQCHKQFISVIKKTAINADSPVLTEYHKLFTDYCCSLLRAEIAKVDKGNYTVNEVTCAV